MKVSKRSFSEYCKENNLFGAEFQLFRSLSKNFLGLVRSVFKIIKNLIGIPLLIVLWFPLMLISYYVQGDK